MFNRDTERIHVAHASFNDMQKSQRHKRALCQVLCAWSHNTAMLLPCFIQKCAPLTVLIFYFY